MGRPAKATGVRVGHDTKKDTDNRGEIERALRGGTEKIKPPGNLSAKQKRIFKSIVKELEASDILGNLDVYILTVAAVAIDRLEQIETQINEDTKLLANTALLQAKDKYTRDLFRCCGELCLSPQSRAKVSAAAKDAQKPPSNLAIILGEDSD